MLVYPSGIDVSTAPLRFLSGRLRVIRREHGTRWRRLSTGRQALLALAHLRHGHTYAQLAVGFDVGTSTAYRYIAEAVEVLAALAPTLTQVRNADPRWQPGNFEKNVEAVGKLCDLAATKGITVSQLALTWLLTRGEHVVPIPGTRSVQRIEENAGAADVPLTGADLATIDEILPHRSFGARCSEDHAPRLDLSPPRDPSRPS